PYVLQAPVPRPARRQHGADPGAAADARGQPPPAARGRRAARSAARGGGRAMRVVVATVRVPFTHGGAAIHAEGLRDALLAEGHEADLVAVPFNNAPPERIPQQMLACRLLDLTTSNGLPVDAVIGLKFPAYLVPHRNKVLWVLHQYRAAYD